MFLLRILYVYFFGKIFIYKMSDYLRLKKNMCFLKKIYFLIFLIYYFLCNKFKDIRF